MLPVMCPAYGCANTVYPDRCWASGEHSRSPVVSPEADALGLCPGHHEQFREEERCS